MVSQNTTSAQKTIELTLGKIEFTPYPPITINDIVKNIAIRLQNQSSS